MTALVWLVSFITNLLNPIGLIIACLLFCSGVVDLSFFIFPLIMGIVGFIFGFATFSYDAAPRLFWIKSRVGIFDLTIGRAFGYLISFFSSTVAIMAIFFS